MDAGDRSGDVKARLPPVDAAAGRFKAELSAGRRPRIEEFLATVGPAERRPLALELVAVEANHLRRRGEPVRQSDYLERFPELSAAELAEIAPAERPETRSPEAAHTTGPDPAATAIGSAPDPDATLVGTLSPAAASGLAHAGGRFRVIRPHAAGGLGEVSVAVDGELGREVALKQIRPRFAASAEARERFVREAEVTGRLEHPGVVPVYGLGAYADGRPFYAMRFVRGESLEQSVLRHHGCEPDAAGRGLALRGLLKRFVDVCNTIAYAHSRGVLHRDLKPANVMLGEYGETLLVDWGLAKVIGADVSPGGGGLAADGRPAAASSHLTDGDGDATQAGRVLGTPAYMSPEQADGRTVEFGPATDVYGLGAILHAILSGRPPVGGNDLDEVLRRVREGTVPGPRAAFPSVPKGLDAICRKALAARPQDRYRSARALATDVERWLADEAPSALPDTRVGRAARWLRRHRGVARAATASLVVVTAVAVGAAWVVDGARGAEAAAKKRAERAADENLARLIRSHVERGTDVWDDDPAAALPWLAEALRRAKPGPASERPHRVRLASAIRALPPPVLFRVTSGESVSFAEITPDGRYVVVPDGETAGLLDLGTGAGPMELRAGSSDGGVTVARVAADESGARVIDAAVAPDGGRLATLHAADIGFAVDETGRVGTPPVRVRTWSLPDLRPLWESELAVAADLYPVRGAVRFGADGGRVVAAVGAILKPAGRVGAWNASDGNPLAAPASHPIGGLDLAEVRMAPDGKRVFLRSYRAEPGAYAWDVGPGEPYPVADAKTAVAFDPSGEVLATVATPAGEGPPGKSGPADRELHLVSLRGGRPSVAVPEAGSVNAAAFAPDGRTLAVAGGRQIRFRGLAGGPAIGGTIEAAAAASDFVTRLAFDPVGSRVAAATHDRLVRVWSAPDGLPLTPPLPCGGDVLDVRLAAGRLLARCSYRGDVVIQAWDLTEPGRVVPGLEIAEAGVAALSRDGRFVAVADPAGGVTIAEPTALPPAVRRFGRTAVPVSAISFDSTSSVVAAAAGESVGLWDAATGRSVAASFEHGHPVAAIALTRGGRALATGGGGRVTIWDAATGRGVPLAGDGPFADAFAFSPDGGLVVASDGAMRLFDAKSGRPVRALERPEEAEPFFLAAAEFDPAGRKLAARGPFDEVEVWVVATGRPACPPLSHAYLARGIAWAASGRLATASWDRTARVWDPADGKAAGPPLEHVGLTETVAFSPDGASLLTACVGGDGESRLWETSTGQPLAPAWPATGSRVAFADGGGRVVVAPGRIRVFDVTPDGRPGARLALLAEVLAGARVEEGRGLTRLTARQIAEGWAELRNADQATKQELQRAASRR